MTQPVSLTTMQDTIARALLRWPADAKRIEKAASLIALGHVSELSPEVYLVRSQTDAGVTYAVASDGSCQDSVRHPDRLCKHAYGVRLTIIAQRREEKLAAKAAAALSARFSALSADELTRLGAFKRQYTAESLGISPSRARLEGWSPR
jgi:hypothetical protein